LEIQGFVILSMAIEVLLGGQMFPLDLMPKPVFQIAQFLPFYYQMYFPGAILTGRLSDPAIIAQNFGIQIFWVLALLALNQFLWVRGLRRHTAVGG
jgi:ABC-2 type transport system permease protein